MPTRKKPKRRAAPSAARRRPSRSARTGAKPKARAAVRKGAKPVARPKSAPKARAARAAARPVGLSWMEEGPRLRTAKVATGRYVLLSHDGVDWKADWQPQGGKPESVAFRRPLQECQAACATHRLQQETNALLERKGFADLTARALQGDALAWKRPRRF